MTEYRTDDWNEYRMEYAEPYRALEPLDREVAIVGEALAAIHATGVVRRTVYEGDKMLSHRRAVRKLFDVPWTAITPRMERLIYALNAIVCPANMVAAGVFCGFTFACNAGAAVGPGACYEATELVGVEIRKEEADRAERNVRRLDPTGTARVVADDAVRFAASFPGPIGLLYLDADGTGQKGKGIYLDILEAAYDRLPKGALVLAHNSVNSAEELADYLEFVRNPANMRASVNVVFDPEGLEVSAK